MAVRLLWAAAEAVVVESDKEAVATAQVNELLDRPLKVAPDKNEIGGYGDVLVDELFRTSGCGLQPDGCEARPIGRLELLV